MTMEFGNPRRSKEVVLVTQGRAKPIKTLFLLTRLYLRAACSREKKDKHVSI